MPCCNTYCLTWVSLTLGLGYLFTAVLLGFLLPWVWGISSSKVQPLLLTLDKGYIIWDNKIFPPKEAAAAKSLQSCLILCDPIDGRLPGSPIPGILQTWTLEWVAISFSNALKWKVKRKSLSRVRLFMTPWAAANQAHPSMGFSRREYWSGVPSPSPPKEARKD